MQVVGPHILDEHRATALQDDAGHRVVDRVAQRRELLGTGTRGHLHHQPLLVLAAKDDIDGVGIGEPLQPARDDLQSGSSPSLVSSC